MSHTPDPQNPGDHALDNIAATVAFARAIRQGDGAGAWALLVGKDQDDAVMMLASMASLVDRALSLYAAQTGVDPDQVLAEWQHAVIAAGLNATDE
jgi:hypothetical protein